MNNEPANAFQDWMSDKGYQDHPITGNEQTYEDRMNNKPVAYVDPIWIDRPDLVMSHQLEIGKLFARTQFTNYVPLYTHPADEKQSKFKPNNQVNFELSDEEIQEIAHGFGAIGWMGDTTYEFARAILRKAQEK